ncbi:MAG: signal peptidase I [Desulfovibrionaceae bacterium]|nr:signal peptidase I [Desulfovibrionaceae bacterium]
MRLQKNIVLEYIEAFVIAVALAMVIRLFIVQAYRIPSASMLQTLQIGDHILVNKFLYGIRVPFTDSILIPISDPQFGDVAVFRYPEDPSKDYIKRIIGLPGDTIELKNKVLYRNGEPVEESYVHYENPEYDNRYIADTFGPIVVPQDSYFVLGDNRDNSEDSRYWGFVKREAIVGKAWRIYWSWASGAEGGFWNKIRFNRIGSKIE